MPTAPITMRAASSPQVYQAHPTSSTTATPMIATIRTPPARASQNRDPSESSLYWYSSCGELIRRASPRSPAAPSSAWDERDGQWSPGPAQHGRGVGLDDGSGGRGEQLPHRPERADGGEPAGLLDERGGRLHL